MSNAIVGQNPNPEPIRPKVTSGLPGNREQIVAQQIGTLLAVVNTYTMAIRVAVPSDSEEKNAVGDKAKYSLETTLMAVNDRMQAILADGPRWDMANYDDLAIRLRDLYANQNQLFNVQKELAEAQMAPHTLLGARVLRLENLTWVAYVGNPMQPNGMLYGAGQTLREACDNFDAAYYATPTDEQRKLYEQNQARTVDTTGNTSPRSDDRVVSSDNREETQAKPPVSDDKDLRNPKGGKRIRRK